MRGAWGGRVPSLPERVRGVTRAAGGHRVEMTLVFRSTRYPTSSGKRGGGRWTRGETPCFWSCPGRACVCRFDSVFFCRRDRLGVLSLVSLLGRPRRSQSVRCPSHGTTYSVHIGDFLRSVSEARCFLFVYSEPVGRRLPVGVRAGMASREVEMASSLVEGHCKTLLGRSIHSLSHRHPCWMDRARGRLDRRR